MARLTFTAGELVFLSRMRVGRLATADNAGQPHVVPIVFSTNGQELYTPIDEKPKRTAPGRLKRVRNLEVNPQVAIVVDEYSEDWTRLAWVLVTGYGKIVKEGDTHTTGVRLLRQKYSQYETMLLDERPLIVVTPKNITSWGAL